ncbi:hypothetical protein [Ferrovibrio xuzhouensis]|uniref:Helix-turn-helix transcriptional regulator n=1 Tax=Ferrovibrio xuzhouensis TaxID=1576914 RepID=A0ABV7VFA6_9PROT
MPRRSADSPEAIRRGPGRPVDAALAQRLEAAVRWRCREIGEGNSLVALSRGIGRGEDTIRAWFAGENTFSLDDLRRMHLWFAEKPRDLPGLLQEVNADLFASGSELFDAEQLTLGAASGPARFSIPGFVIRGETRNLTDRDLLDIATALRNGRQHVLDSLAGMGLLSHTHVLAMDVRSDAIRATHFASETPIKFNRSAVDRDLRSLHFNDRGDLTYGMLLHRQMHEIIQADRPVIHVISAPGVRYRRLAIPLWHRFVAAIPFDIALDQPIEFH